MARTRSLIAFAMLLLIASAAAAQERNTRDFLGLGPVPDKAAAQAGEPLYAQNCATCHGKTARGAQAPNLVRSPLVLHDEKGEEISSVVKKGRPQAGMPAFPDLTDTQIYDIAEFIHLQIELAANRGTYREQYASSRNQVTGDAAQGKQFFEVKCSGCHSVAKDLAGIGAKYPQPSVMLTRIAWPTSPDAKHATVTLAGGQSFTGSLVKEDDFDVELKDAQGELHTWPRELVTVSMADPLAGHRTLLRQYTDADLHNLTAYLESIR